VAATIVSLHHAALFMRTETRANLIFITVFLLIALPGIYKLTGKAYKAGGRDPAMRTAVRGEWAYMDPTPQVRDLPRVVPPRIGQIVQKTAARLERMQPGFTAIVRSENSIPVMSRDLGLQLLGSGNDGGKYQVGLFGWNSKYAPLPSQFKITGKRGDAEVTGEVTNFEPMNLPVELRMDLQDVGYIMPPDSLMWLIVTFPGETPIDSMSVHFELDQTTIDDEMKLPKPPTTMP
jgi:hypothetical protein